METNNCVSVFSVHYCYLSLKVNFNNTFINGHNEKKIIPFILTSKSISRITISPINNPQMLQNEQFYTFQCNFFFVLNKIYSGVNILT